VAAEITNTANDTTQLALLVAASPQNLTGAGAERGVGTFVADAGYWSIPNATLETDAEILIATVAPTNGISDPEDPRVQARHAVLERVERGELTLRAAAAEMGISDTWAGKLLALHRAREPQPVAVRAAMNTSSPAPMAWPVTRGARPPSNRSSATSK
jgi:hypothetical protein